MTKPQTYLAKIERVAGSRAERSIPHSILDFLIYELVFFNLPKANK